MTDHTWRPIDTAPEGVEVETNVQTLRRNGRIYVYYAPTHWRPAEGPS